MLIQNKMESFCSRFTALLVNSRWAFSGVMLMFALLVGSGSAVPPDEAAGVRLVGEEGAAAVIVLPDHADARSPEHRAAELLATFIEKMSGEKLAIKQERELEAVEVREGWIEPGFADWETLGDEHVPGEAPDQPDGFDSYVLIGESELVSKLGVDASGLGPGGVRVKTTGNAVVILGGPSRIEDEPGSDDGGLQHAVIEVLERLGMRYLWPGELGMVIPAATTVVLEPMDVTYTPEIRRRGLRWGRLGDRGEIGLERLGLSTMQWESGREKALGQQPPISWLAWHRTGGRMPNFGHAGAGLRNGSQYLESHPEWFAMQADGTRDQAGSGRWRLCKSNLDLIEHVANDIIEQRNANPNLELVSLDPNDGGGETGWCQCEECKALDPADAPRVEILVYPTNERRAANRQRVEHASLTDRKVFYWNSVAERVAEVHPDLLFGVSAYGAFSHPPTERELHPNLVVRYVPAHTDYVEGWKEAGAQRMFWRPNILLVNRRDGKKRSIIDQLASNMTYFADVGIVQTDFDSVNHHWATLGPSYYAAARLTWNPGLTRDEIIADFASRGFGSGAPYIEQYFHKIESLTETGIVGAFSNAGDRRYTPEVLAELRRLLNEAQAATDDSVIEARIAFLRMGLNLTEVQEMLDDLSWRARQGMDVDEELARRLVDLNALMMRDIILNHHLVSNAANLVWATGTFARFAPVRGRTVTPSDEALLDRFDDPNFGLTGQEQSLEDMFEAFGL